MADKRQGPLPPNLSSFKPDLGADWKGGATVYDNIRITDCANGGSQTFLQCEGASTDPMDASNIIGKFRERQLKERESILKQNLDRVSGSR
jgi:hypothetical protein